VLIEDTAELQIDRPNLVRFEARREQANVPAVTIRELLRATLRHRPDRILVGEVRGAEAFDLLQALNTGHLGSLSTIHANSAEQALMRLAHCVLTANVGLPHHSIREAIALAIHLVVHLARIDGRRRVTGLVAVATIVMCILIVLVARFGGSGGFVHGCLPKSDFWTRSVRSPA
jgi:pilus assembly protein CpaF